MWTNKHVITALLVAPILAIIAWFGVDYLVAEQAQPAEQGTMYPLVAHSNCRYDSGQCDLANNDVKMSIRPVDLQASRTILSLESEYVLEQVRFALVLGDDEVLGSAEPTQTPDGDTLWVINIPVHADPEAALRIAVTVQASVYFVEVPVVFMRSSPRPRS
ncbi:MAG: hypothetical protein ACR2QX_03960 [Woeseiaceae bacterium]